MMQQEAAPPVTQQPAPQPAPQATPQPAPQATPQPAPCAPDAPQEPATLHDFALNLLTDPAALSAFQLDPEGVLDSCGLSDVTAGDVQEILPLVLDSASIANTGLVDQLLSDAGDLTAVDQLTAIAGDVQGAGVIGDAVSVPALVDDFSGLGDVSNTLDANVLTNNEVVSEVTGLVHPNDIVSEVTEVVAVPDVHNVTDALTHDITETVGQPVEITGNVVQNVAQVGDVHSGVGQVLGDVTVGDLDLLGHVGDTLDLHL